MHVDEAAPGIAKLRALRLGVAALLVAATAAAGVFGHTPGALASSPAAGGSNATDAYEVRTCDGGSFGLTAPEYESLELHNEAREGAGLGHLCVNPTLTEAARAHASDMMERDYFSHYSAGGAGTSPIQRMEAEGYAGWNAWGENIAWGSGYKGDSKEIFAALMNSAGHRENILKDGFLEVGIGAVGGEYNGNAGSGMYAMDFGARAGQPHEYPEVLAENGGGSGGQPAEDDPLAGQPAASPEGEVTPGEGEGTPEAVEPQPEPGESTEEEKQEVADAQKAVCEIFAETREGIISNLREQAEAAAGQEGPAGEIIAETKTDIADDFERSLLTTSFCDFGEGTPGEGTPEDGTPEDGTPEEGTSPETTSPETSSPESTSIEQVEKTTVIQQSSEGGDSSEDASEDASGGSAGGEGVDAAEIRRQVERDVRRALAGTP